MDSILIADGRRCFAIEYEPGRREVSIDGVSVSTELFSQMFVDPRVDVWVRFKREGDTVLAISRPALTEFGVEEPSQLDRIEAATKSILEEVHKMAEDQAQLDTAVAQIGTDDAAILTAVQAAGTSVSTALADLAAKIAASPVAADFTSEVASLTQAHTDFQNALTSLAAVKTSADAADGATPSTPATPAPAA